jgi:hypothetical protein
MDSYSRSIGTVNAGKERATSPENGDCLPILVIGHRRAQELAQVLSCVRQIAPRQLFLAMDGPRSPEEQELTNAARTAAEQAVDWPCKVEYLFSPVNRGCRRFVLEAISWFFEKVDAGIILEDDILIHPEFPDFAAQLLKSPKIGIVAACTYPELLSPDFNDPAFLSRIPAIWGWACTRRIWTAFRNQQQDRPRELITMAGRLAKRIGVWQSLLFSLCLQLIDQEKLQAWDYEFAYFLITHQILCAYPKRSMASNIGFSPLATHTAAAEPLTAPLTEGPLYLGAISVSSLVVNKGYMARQALNTPFLPDYRLHTVNGLIAHGLEKIGVNQARRQQWKRRLFSR